jgi:hypothetical protein
MLPFMLFPKAELNEMVADMVPCYRGACSFLPRHKYRFGLLHGLWTRDTSKDSSFSAVRVGVQCRDSVIQLLSVKPLFDIVFNL